jgi:uncharacterized membrane protein
MDFGGINLVFMEVVGAVILFAVILWVVLRTRSKGKKSSPERTEQGTRDLYEEEERRRREGTEDL